MTRLKDQLPTWFQAPLHQAALGIGLVTLYLIISATLRWTGALPGNDDLMRLVEVRDLLGGQGWWDVHQSRFLTPEGGAMHWSRIPDLMIGGLILVLKPFFGAEGAEHAALILWPRLLLLGALSALALSLHRLGAGRVGMLAGIVFFLATHAMVQFQPGRIDHHGFELVMVLAAFAALVSPRPTWRSGAFAGLCIAAMMSVAIESLPMAVGLIGFAGLLWIVRAEAMRSMLFGLGAGLAGFAAFFYVADAPGPGAGREVCDAYGNFHAVGLVLGGAALAGLAHATERLAHWRGRLVAGMGAGVAVALTCVAVDPGCLASPYSGVSAGVMKNWMSSVTEARNVMRLIATSPGFALGVFGFALAALAGGLAVLRQTGKPDRAPLAGLIALLGLSILVMAWQVRAVVFAHGLAALMAGYVAGVLWPALMSREGTARVGALAALLVLAPTTWQAAGARIAPKNDTKVERAEVRVSCRSPEAMDKLAALPAAKIFAPIDLGTAILANTEHAIFTAPYHRNAGAIANGIEIFQAPPEEARQMLQDLGADYVYACPGLGEMELYASRAPDGLAAALTAGTPPAWLEPVEAGSPVYAVRRDSVAGTADKAS